MIRAIETAEIIRRHLPADLPVHQDPMLCEGAPIPPEPSVGHWRPEQFVRGVFLLIKLYILILNQMSKYSSFTKMAVELRPLLESIFTEHHRSSWRTRMK